MVVVQVESTYVTHEIEFSQEEQEITCGYCGRAFEDGDKITAVDDKTGFNSGGTRWLYCDARCVEGSETD